MNSIKVKEKYAKSILFQSKVRDYAVNPYTGCEHSYTYWYVRFIKNTRGIKKNGENLVERVSGKVNHAVIDRLNYHNADWIYKKHGLEYTATADKFFSKEKGASSEV